MTVAQNVAFGLEMKKVPKTEIKRRVAEALELVHLSGKENRRPKQLSGGQQQRVALARALVNRPKVLLLDEPLGALDLKLRKAMQGELKALQEQVGITFIYVTHDQEEALTMSDRIAVMNQGNVLQVGGPEDIYEHPRSRFVADFIGETNFIHGEIVESGSPAKVKISENIVVPAIQADEERLSKGEKAILSIRPEKIFITAPGELPKAERTETFTHVPATLKKIVYLGTDRRYIAQIASTAEVVIRVQNTQKGKERLKIGDIVSLHWDSQYARLLKE